jgi:hypothetical protein
LLRPQEYQKAIQEQVYTRHLCRLNPWPEPLRRTFRNFNPKPYNYLQGPNEFIITGKLKNWDRWADLPRIHTRTLVLGAQYDEMSPPFIYHPAFAVRLSALKQRLRRFEPNRTTDQIHGAQIPMDAFLILSGLLLFLMAMAVENKTSR